MRSWFYMLLNMCKRCGRGTPYPSTVCDDCKPLVEQQQQERKQASDRRYNRGRSKQYTRFYKSSDWQRLRNRYMQDMVYKCERCGKIATEVHHIKPIQTKDGWLERLDYNNLMALCVKCHNNEHNRF